MGIVGNVANFADETKEGLVLVDFHATWCGPCRMLDPVLDELIKDNSELKLVKVDVDESRELASQYQVMSVPTLILFKDGQVVDTQNGFLPKEMLEAWIQKHE